MEVAIPWTTVAKAKFSKKRLGIRLHSRNQTGVGPEMVQFNYRTWHRVGLYARLVPIVYEALPKQEPRLYRLRLHFAEIEDTRPGERVFDVKVQDRVALRGLDVVRESGRDAALVKEIDGIRASDTLTLELAPRTERPPILNGVELRGE